MEDKGTDAGRATSASYTKGSIVGWNEYNFVKESHLNHWVLPHWYLITNIFVY